MELVEQRMIPQVDVVNSNPNPDADALKLTGNTMADLQAIAKEMGVQVDSTGKVVGKDQPKETPVPPVIQQAQTVPQTQSAPVENKDQTQEIPAKFQNPDGSVNEEKVAKSTASLDQAIAKYRAKELEFQRLQNKVNNPPPAVVNQPVQTQPAQPLPLSQLEIQVARDLIAEHAAVGIQLPEAQAIAQARVQVKLQEARYQGELAATADLRQRLEDHERARELQGLVDEDPWLASDEAISALWQVRQENPWLNQAPKPWEAAYTFFKGRNGHGSQVKTPTPSGLTAKAPPTPVSPVARVQKTVNLKDTQALRNMDSKELEAVAKQQFPGLKLNW